MQPAPHSSAFSLGILLIQPQKQAPSCQQQTSTCALCMKGAALAHRLLNEEQIDAQRALS